jgi:hypothetical protein
MPLPKILAGSILIFMVILGILAILSVLGGISSSETIVVRGTVLPYVKVSSPASACIWELKPSAPGIYTKKAVLKVAANTGWKVIVKDADEVTAGHMAEWTGTTYASLKLKAPLSVSADREVTLPEGGIIQTGTTVGEHNIEVTLSQEVAQEDLPLEDGHVYRIALSFEGSPVD